MKTRKKIALVLGSSAVALIVWISGRSARAAEQTSIATLMIEAEKAPTLRPNLLELTDQIGGRVPGTPAMEHAIRWGMEKFKAAGADEVHTEDFTIQRGWGEGPTHIVAKFTPSKGAGEVVTHRTQLPTEVALRAVSLGWGPATQLSAVEVVDLGAGTHDDFAHAADLKGKAVLVHSEPMKTWEDLFAEYQRVPIVMDESAKRGVRAILIQSTRPQDLLYRHINTNHGEADKVPALIVAREDAGRLARLLAEKAKVSVDISMPNQLTGPIHTANVVAELRGSEKPDEYVVLGAHLDSWELGTGALDNGCNAALVIEALRAIKASGIEPKRTIRFILFSGEEEGLLGSWAYVRAHRADMDKYAGAVIFDSGTGRVTGFSIGGRKDMLNAANEIVVPLKAWDAATLTTDAQWGTDHFDFMLEGVPTFVANQEEANYLPNYHASSDTFDKVDFTNLKRHVAEAAAVTVGLANRPERVGPRISRQEVERISHESGLEGEMRSADIWRDWESGERGRTP
jgi:Zn-dependent M28 family amino/carboxypeptidase